MGRQRWNLKVFFVLKEMNKLKDFKQTVGLITIALKKKKENT